MLQRLLFVFLLAAGGSQVFAQQGTPATAPGTLPGTEPASGYHLISPVVQPTFSPGVLQLMELEGRFSDDVAKLGGKAFAQWFAEDAVTLQNGKPAVQGRGAIAANASWDPKDYSLIWTPQGAQMSASNDMGFTWGHYKGASKDVQGNPIVTSGRYITIWKKQADGAWKVAMEASSDDAPDSGSCCALPKP